MRTLTIGAPPASNHLGLRTARRTGAWHPSVKRASGSDLGCARGAQTLCRL